MATNGLKPRSVLIPCAILAPTKGSLVRIKIIESRAALVPGVLLSERSGGQPVAKVGANLDSSANKECDYV